MDKLLLNILFGVINGALSGANKSDLTELENKVYEAVKINQNLTAKEISENLMIPFRSVQRYLSTLKEKGFIVRECYIDGYWNKENEEDYLTEI